MIKWSSGVKAGSDPMFDPGILVRFVFFTILIQITFVWNIFNHTSYEVIKWFSGVKWGSDPMFDPGRLVRFVFF